MYFLSTAIKHQFQLWWKYYDGIFLENKFKEWSRTMWISTKYTSLTSMTILGKKRSMSYYRKQSLKQLIKRLENFPVPYQNAVLRAGKVLLTDWCRKHTLWPHVQSTCGGKTMQVDSFNKSKVLNKPNSREPRMSRALATTSEHLSVRKNIRKLQCNRKHTSVFNTKFQIKLIWNIPHNAGRVGPF
jgi:hypothetical protein